MPVFCPLRFRMKWMVLGLMLSTALSIKAQDVPVRYLFPEPAFEVSNTSDADKSVSIHVNYQITEQNSAPFQLQLVTLAPYVLNADTGIIQILGVWDTLPTLNQPNNYTFQQLGAFTIDSIRFAARHVNTSGISDTVQLKLFRTTASGYPNLQAPLDTFLLTGTQLTTQNQLTFSVNRTYPTLTGLAYQLLFKGSTADTLQVVGAFTYSDSCTTTNLPLPQRSVFYPSAFMYDAYYQQQFPANSGGDLYFDCNQNGVFDSITDGANPIQLFFTDLFVTSTNLNTFIPTKPNIVVYPNPASEWIHLNAEVVMQSFRCINIHGQVVKSGLLQANQSQILISELPSGTYFLQVTIQEFTYTYPFHVSH